MKISKIETKIKIKIQKNKRNRLTEKKKTTRLIPEYPINQQHYKKKLAVLLKKN